MTRSAWPTNESITSGGATLLRDAGVPMLIMPFDRYLGYEGNVGTFTDTSLLINARLGEVYEGLKPPALGRFGETDDRSDELV